MCGIRGMFGEDDRQELLSKSFDKIQSRGPDFSQIIDIGSHKMGFHRLAIMDLSPSGNQPFLLDTYDKYIYRTCNGEIYNYQKLVKKYNLTELLTSQSDCEIIGHIYISIGFENMIKELDGEFAIAMITLDKNTKNNDLYLARDPYGIRPLFIGNGNIDQTNIYRSSELKGLNDLCKDIKPFAPGQILIKSENITNIYTYYNPIYQNNSLTFVHDENKSLADIKKLVYDAVSKRLVSDRPLGCLLSGGLDSSLVCGIAAKLSEQPIHTFTIGLEGGSDIIFAESVAKYIGSHHTTFVVTIEEALQAIDEVIYTIESRDTTTIRASVWQYLIGKKISKETNIKVLLTGEGSDEMSGGYMYFHNAPDPTSFDAECQKLLSDIYLYDGLRVDRSMATHGLEVRIPLLDPELVQNYLSIDPTLRMPKTRGIEKYMLRKAFEADNIIPSEVLRRKKEAFSDGVSQHSKSRFEIIQEKIDTIISDEEFAEFLKTKSNIYINKKDNLTSSALDLGFPIDKCDTKEKYYYYKKFVEYFGQNNLSVIPYYRMPKWSGNISDPSARVLDVYKK